MATMKEAIVSKGPSVKIVDSKIPEPGPEQVVIKVVVSGSNPKDWWVHSFTLLSVRLRGSVCFRHTQARCLQT